MHSPCGVGRAVAVEIPAPRRHLASSVLVLTKSQGTLMVQDGTAKFATGAVFSGGVIPPSSLQAGARTSVPVTQPAADRSH